MPEPSTVGPAGHSSKMKRRGDMKHRSRGTKSWAKPWARGQALVEFALVITLFMFLLVAVFEFAHLALAYTMTAAGVREAARYGAASGLSENGLPRYADCDAIRAAALRLGALAGMQADDIVIEYDHGPDTAVFATCPPGEINLGDRIRVRAEVRFTPWVLNLGTLTLRSQTERTILVAIPLDAPSTFVTVPTSTPTPTATPGGPPPPPVDPTVLSGSVGNSGQCDVTGFGWAANTAWTDPVADYKVRHAVDGVYSAILSTSGPPYDPSERLRTGQDITFEVWATFVTGEISEMLRVTYTCQADGSLQVVTP